MLRFYYALYALIAYIILCFLSCSKEQVCDDSDYQDHNSVCVKSVIVKCSGDDYIVTTEDMEYYARFMNKLEGKKFTGEVSDISPVFYKDVLACYVVNYQDGWQVISSDKRGPIVLAEYQHGNFSFEKARESVRTWLVLLFGDINYRRINPDVYYQNIRPKDLESELSCCAQWESIIKRGANSNYRFDPIPPEPAGEYQYSYTYTTTSQDGVSHLMSTHWDQWAPYNSYIPLSSSDSVTRCPAGCVNIAGAQVLYYLHGFIGKPVSSPTTGFCVGYDDMNTMFFSNYQQTTWDVMDTPLDTLDFLGLFIGSVAALSETKFKISGSRTTINKLRQHTFSYYGVTGNYSTTYNRDTVYNNLKSSLPVIFGGNRFESIFSWPGHAWVIDGYVKEVTTYHDVYEWVYLEPPTGPVPYHPNYETTYQSSQLLYFKMNWGYGNSGGVDDAYYSPNGSWVNPLIPDSNPYVFQKEVYSRFR